MHSSSKCASNVLQIEHQLLSARHQIESMLAAAGREGASVLQELEGRVRGISDVDLVAWENWSASFRIPPVSNVPNLHPPLTSLLWNI
jgi:hypothetical protein